MIRTWRCRALPMRWCGWNSWHRTTGMSAAGFPLARCAAAASAGGITTTSSARAAAALADDVVVIPPAEAAAAHLANGKPAALIPVVRCHEFQPHHRMGNALHLQVRIISHPIVHHECRAGAPAEELLQRKQ